SFHVSSTTDTSTLPYTTLFRSISYFSQSNMAVSLVLPHQRYTLSREQIQQTFPGSLLTDALELDAGATEIPLINPIITPTIMDVDRKSTRLNSSHSQISYAVFC